MSVIYKNNIAQIIAQAKQLRPLVEAATSLEEKEQATRQISTLVKKLQDMVQEDAKLLEQVTVDEITTPAIKLARDTRQTTTTQTSNADDATRQLAAAVLNRQEAQRIHARLRATIKNCKNKHPENRALLAELTRLSRLCPRAAVADPLADKTPKEKAKVREFISQNKLDKDLYATVDAQVKIITTKAQSAQIVKLCKDLVDGPLQANDPHTAINQLLQPGSGGLQEIHDNANNPSKSTTRIFEGINKIPAAAMHSANFDIAEHTKYTGDFVPPQITLLQSQLNGAHSLLQQLQQQAIEHDDIDPAVVAKAKEKFVQTQSQLARQMEELSEHCRTSDLLKGRSLISENKKHQIAAFVNAVKASGCAPGLNQVVPLKVIHNEAFYQAAKGDEQSYAAIALAIDTNGLIHFSFGCGISMDERQHIRAQLQGLELPPNSPMHLLAQNNLLSSAQAVNSVKHFSIKSVAQEVPGVEISMNHDGSVHVEFKNAKARQDFISLLAKRNNEYKQWKQNNLSNNTVTEAEIKQDAQQTVSGEIKQQPGPGWKATNRQQSPAADTWKEQQDDQPDWKSSGPSNGSS